MTGRAALLALALLLPAATDDPLAGRVPGKAKECLDLDRVQGPDIVDAHTILYRENRRRVWRTGPVGACSFMRTGDSLVIESFAGRQICRNDRFYVRTPGTLLGGSCRFTAFVPYDLAGSR